MQIVPAPNSLPERHAAAAVTARAVLARIGSEAIRERRNLTVSLGSRKGRVATMRRVHNGLGRNAMGYAHDAECREGVLGYMSLMRSASLYKGIGIVSARAGLDPRRADVALSEELEVLIDIHAMKRLALRAGASDLDAQIALCRPVIGWCAVANRIGIEGRFVVPTAQGIFFCRRDPLPDEAGLTAHGPVARIVTFYSLEEMTAAQKKSWSDLRAAGIVEMAPAYPSMDPPAFNAIAQLCAMAGADLVMRTENLRPVM